jgi:O-antigen/teichoic acid export membrane protein
MLKMIVTIGAIQFLAIVINLVRSKAVAVLLGPEGVGTISVIDQVVQFAAYLSAFSLPLASIKFLSRAHSQGAEEFRRMYSAFLTLLFTLAAAGTAITMAVILFRPETFGVTLARLRVPMLVAAASIPAMSILGFITNVLAAAQKTRSSAVMAVASNSAQTTGVIVGLLAASVLGLYTGSLVMNITLVVGMIIYLKVALGLPLRLNLRGFAGEMRASRELFAYSVCLYLAAAVYSFSLLMARMAVLAKLGESAAGLLQSVIALAAAIGLVLSPTNGLYITPIMNREIPAAEKMRTSTEFQKRLIVVLALIGMPMALFPDVLVQVLFSQRFLAAAPQLYLFITAQCILQIAGVYQAVLVGLDDLKFYTLFTCGGFGALGILARILAPRHGIAGVGVAFTCGTSLVLLMSWLRTSRRFGYSLPPALLGLMCYTFSAMLVGGAALGAYRTSDLAMSALKVGVYICFAAGLMLFQKREERDALYGLWARFRSNTAVSSI